MESQSTVGLNRQTQATSAADTRQPWKLCQVSLEGANPFAPVTVLEANAKGPALYELLRNQPVRMMDERSLAILAKVRPEAAVEFNTLEIGGELDLAGLSSRLAKTG